MWKITKNKYDPERLPQSCNFNPNDSTPCRFRMKDDDGEIYYEGESSRITFEPLDEFGTPDGGATSIEYYAFGIGWAQL